MLLAGTRWRASKTAEPPIFLTGTDFGALSAAVKASKEADVIRLLPSYASGARALENISLERFCVVSGDGHVLRWNDDSNTWEGFDASVAWAPEELAMMREDRPGPACLPRGSRAWPAREQQSVIGFLESARPADEAETALAKAKLTRVVSARSADAAIAKDFRPDMLCLISAAGRFVDFNVTEVPDWKLPQNGWNSSESKDREEALSSWREEATKAIQADDSHYSDPHVCYLGAHKPWPADLRDAVTRFLGRLPG